MAPPPVPRSLAALATVPGREAALTRCLTSLRPQVAELRVVCHDMTEPPAIVRELADAWICEPDTQGSASKLRWSRDWSGLYLGCDDDFLYPENYAATMLRWVRRWRGKALVCCHGRLFPAKPESYLDHKHKAAPLWPSKGGWLNFPGAAGIAWDSRLKVPDRVPEKNQEEAYLALWAQANRVPIWLVPKPRGWLEWLLPRDGSVRTIYSDEKSDGYSIRHRLVAEQNAKGGWQCYKAS